MNSKIQRIDAMIAWAQRGPVGPIAAGDLRLLADEVVRLRGLLDEAWHRARDIVVVGDLNPDWIVFSGDVYDIIKLCEQRMGPDPDADKERA